MTEPFAKIGKPDDTVFWNQPDDFRQTAQLRSGPRAAAHAGRAAAKGLAIPFTDSIKTGEENPPVFYGKTAASVLVEPHRRYCQRPFSSLLLHRYFPCKRTVYRRRTSGAILYKLTLFSPGCQPRTRRLLLDFTFPTKSLAICSDLLSAVKTGTFRRPFRPVSNRAGWRKKAPAGCKTHRRFEKIFHIIKPERIPSPEQRGQAGNGAEGGRLQAGLTAPTSNCALRSLPTGRSGKRRRARGRRGRSRRGRSRPRSCGRGPDGCSR